MCFVTQARYNICCRLHRKKDVVGLYLVAFILTKKVTIIFTYILQFFILNYVRVPKKKSIGTNKKKNLIRMGT